ncbi:MAG: CBS domain-containing protein [Chloroflexota bacterium]|nr:CBS domain-containing protein [Chloroflexota bacterium]
MATDDAGWVATCRRFEAMTVAEADRLMAVEPTLAGPEESLLVVARRVVDRPACRIVCVVDAGGVLLGLLPVADLAFAALVHVMPEIFLRHVNDLPHSAEFATLAHGRTAGDVMRPPLVLRADDRLEEAFGRLLRAGLEGLPIVDDAGRVTGYLNVPEFLCAWLTNCAPDGREDGR